MELLKLLSASEIFAQVVSFLILLFLLRIFVWKKFLKLLDSRRDKIASEFEKIEVLKSELGRIKADYEEKMENIEQVARDRTKEAVAEGKKIAAELRQESKAASERTIENAKEAIRAEVAAAKEVLKKDVVELTISVTEKLLAEKLNDTADRKLVEQFLEGIDKIK